MTRPGGVRQARPVTEVAGTGGTGRTGLPRRARRLVVEGLRLELRMYVGLVRLLARRHDVPDDTEPHRYVGAVAVLLWAISAVSAVELVVLHLVIPWEWLRITADVVGIWGLVWCLGMTGCHHVYPHLVGPDGLAVRAARRTPQVVVPHDRIATVSLRERTHEGSRAVRLDDTGGTGDPRALSVVVGGRTNVDVRLSSPLRTTVRGVVVEVDEVRLLADDPRALRRALLAG